MKTRISYLSLALFFFTGMQLCAQLSLGIHTAINRTNFSGDPPSSAYFEPRMGYHVGIRTDYRFLQSVSVSLQPSFAQAAIKYVVADSLDERDSMMINMTAISLPVQAVIWSENGRFFVTGGFKIGYNHKFIAEHNSTEIDLISEIKKFNLSAQFGAGFFINIGRPYLVFELRYTQGLVDINESIIHGEKYLPRTKLTNMSFQISFQIPVGDKDSFKIRKKN